MLLRSQPGRCRKGFFWIGKKHAERGTQREMKYSIDFDENQTGWSAKFYLIKDVGKSHCTNASRRFIQ